jgi:hypothetical protein
LIVGVLPEFWSGGDDTTQFGMSGIIPPLKKGVDERINFALDPRLIVGVLPEFWSGRDDTTQFGMSGIIPPLKKGVDERKRGGGIFICQAGI